MIVWSSQPWNKILLFRFFETDAKFKSVFTVTSDINDVLFAFVSRVFVPYIRFIAVNHN
jgi:hypothetical protein